MEKNENSGIEIPITPENKETVRRVATEIMEPALQKALAAAREEATPQEAFSALTNCYGSLLVDLLGRKAAATFLQNHALYIATLEEAAVTD